jgi:hypothetical protein
MSTYSAIVRYKRNSKAVFGRAPAEEPFDQENTSMESEEQDYSKSHCSDILTVIVNCPDMGFTPIRSINDVRTFECHSKANRH